MRSFKIYLDGQHIADLKDKEIKELSIQEGQHHLSAKIDWCGSKILEFKVAHKDVKIIEITGFVFSKWLMPLAIVTVFIYCFLNAVFQINSLFLGCLMMAFFGYLLYYISFGRNQYLQIKEINPSLRV